MPCEWTANVLSLHNKITLTPLLRQDSLGGKARCGTCVWDEDNSPNAIRKNENLIYKPLFNSNVILVSGVFLRSCIKCDAVYMRNGAVITWVEISNTIYRSEAFSAYHMTSPSFTGKDRQLHFKKIIKDRGHSTNITQRAAHAWEQKWEERQSF